MYRILVEAGRPLTVAEIAKKMPSAFTSAAMNAYREHKEVNDPTWLEGKGDRWSADAKTEALQWWVRKILTKGLSTGLKIFKSSCSGIKGGDRRKASTYTPGDHPPYVIRREWVQKNVRVPWTPEDEAALATGHVAGMEFLREFDAIQREGKRPRGADVDNLLDLAERAIRARDA